jgi:hypothetical protein
LLLALLSKNGLESRNQNCTFAFVENLIEQHEISLTKEELKEIFDKDVTEDLQHSSKILDIRENMQYSIKTSMEEQEFLSLKQKTKFLFSKQNSSIYTEVIICRLFPDSPKPRQTPPLEN